MQAGNLKNQREQQSRLKQRLVGAIVLVALGVIFIPMILNGEREQGFIVNGSSIPAKPAEIENIRQIEFATNEALSESDHVADKVDAEKSEIRIPVDERSAPLTPAEPQSVQTKPIQKKLPKKASAQKKSLANKKRTSSKPEKSAQAPVASKNKVASVAPTTLAWAVQVGSFQQKSNALTLRDKLRKQKYKAFVEALHSNATLIYRVRLGPYVSRIGAEKVRDKLLVQQKMKGLVVKHP